MIDGGYDIDLGAVVQNIEEAEVVTLHFPMLRQTLLVDTRSTTHDGPLVRVVPMVNNTQERFDSLHAMRPHLSRPHSITMIPWARSISALEVTGVWARLLTRLETCGDETTLVDARRAYSRLRSLELLELRDAIIGRQYRTVWRASRAGEAR